jgi:hypothetical protein
MCTHMTVNVTGIVTVTVTVTVIVFVTSYDGNYSRFLKQKKERREAWQNAYDAQMKRVKAEKVPVSFSSICVKGFGVCSHSWAQNHSLACHAPTYCKADKLSRCHLKRVLSVLRFCHSRLSKFVSHHKAPCRSLRFPFSTFREHSFT